MMNTACIEDRCHFNTWHGQECGTVTPHPLDIQFARDVLAHAALASPPPAQP